MRSEWMYLFYFLLAAALCFGARCVGKGEWNDGFTSLEQTKTLQGMMALGVALHHMAQKTCAPWHPQQFRVHGLDPFLDVGYLFVGEFLFCSGLGVYRSLKGKPDYLKGFLRRRVAPIAIAYYLSEFLYTGIRLAMGEKMDVQTLIWTLSGLHMANFNAWYIVAIVFFYLAFWAAFRACRREGTAILWVFLFALGYTLLGACIDHQDDWWMRGEWWYNSILLFPLGLLFGRHEARVTAFLKRGWGLWLALAFAAAVLLFQQSEWLNEYAWGYYGAVGDPMRVPHRLMSAGLQWLVALAFVACCFLLTMKVRFGNGALTWLGGATLEFYLVHGIFVELFGYNFHDISNNTLYIRNVALYVAAVLACSVPASMLFGAVWRRLVGLTRGMRISLNGMWCRGLLVAAALLAGFLLTPLLNGDRDARVMSGMEFHIPKGYTRRYSDSRYAVWEYSKGDQRPGNLILDADIRDGRARNLSTAEEVLESCDWLAEAELYVNPQGVRMVRGFADYSGGPERRYYIETPGAVMLMCMREDSRYYDFDACEAAILQVAEGVRVH